MLSLRPGDVPYFLECLEDARQYEKNRLMQGGLSMLFGRQPSRYYIPDSYGDEEHECECE